MKFEIDSLCMKEMCEDDQIVIFVAFLVGDLDMWWPRDKGSWNICLYFKSSEMNGSLVPFIPNNSAENEVHSETEQCVLFLDV